MHLTPAQLRGHVQYGIITIREDEFEACLDFFKPSNLCGGERTYNVGFVDVDSDKGFHFALVRCPEQGHSKAQATANDMIADLNPDCIVLVGICGAVPESEFSLGDVVIATRVHDFSVQAAIKGKTNSQNLGGPMHKRIQNWAANINSLLKMDPDFEKWSNPDVIKTPCPTINMDDAVSITKKSVYLEAYKKQILQSLHSNFDESGQKKRNPIVTAQSIASGNLLLKDPNLLRQWLEQSRELKAVEMELPGVYEAAQRVDGNKLVLAIRGISDIVGVKRTPNWTSYACRVAASFAYHCLKIKSDPIVPPARKLAQVGKIVHAPAIRNELQRSDLERKLSLLMTDNIRILISGKPMSGRKLLANAACQSFLTARQTSADGQHWSVAQIRVPRTQDSLRVPRMLFRAMNMDIALVHTQMGGLSTQDIDVSPKEAALSASESLLDIFYANGPEGNFIFLFENSELLSADLFSQRMFSYLLDDPRLRNNRAIFIIQHPSALVFEFHSHSAEEIFVSELSEGEAGALLTGSGLETNDVISCLEELKQVNIPEVFLYGVLREALRLTQILLNPVEATKGSFDGKRLAELATRSLEQIVRMVLEPQQLEITDDIEQARPTFTAFLTFAMLSPLRIDVGWLERSGINREVRNVLRACDWLTEVDGAASLSGAPVYVLRQAFGELQAQCNENAIENIFFPLVDEALSHSISRSSPNSITSILEDAAHWLRSAAPDVGALSALIEAYSVSANSGDITFLAVQSRDGDFSRAITRLGSASAESKIVQLLIASVIRARQTGEKTLFETRFLQLISLLNKDKSLFYKFIRQLDQLTFGSSFLDNSSRAAVIERIQPLLDIAMHQILETSEDPYALSQHAYALSFVLNVCDGMFHAGRRSEVTQILSYLDSAVESISQSLLQEKMPLPVIFISMLSRFWEQKSRDATKTAQADALLKCRQLALAAMQMSDGARHWMIFYLRRVRNELEGESEGSERLALVDSAVRECVRVFDIGRLPADVASYLAALYRRAAELCVDLKLREHGLFKARELLEPILFESQTLLKTQGDTRPVATFGRIALSLLAQEDWVAIDARGRRELYDTALGFCNDFLETSASADLWEVFLRLRSFAEDAMNSSSEIAVGSDVSGVNGEFQTLYDDVKQCERWLAAQTHSTGVHCRLSVLCERYRIRQNGTLVDEAKRRLPDDLDWDGISPAHQLQRIESVFNMRKARAQKLIARYGDFLEPHLFLATLLMQYQIQVIRFAKKSNRFFKEVEFMIKDLTNRFSDDYKIHLHAALFFRYLWRFSEALRSFDRALAVACSPEDRRTVELNLAECLFIVGANGRIVRLGDGTEMWPRQALQRASAICADLLFYNRTTRRASLFVDQIDLALGKDVEVWLVAKDFDSLFGHDVYTFLSEIAQKLENAQIIDVFFPRSAQEALLFDFTNPFVLRSLGFLFVLEARRRHAGKEDYYKRALVAFDAAGMFERSWRGSESTTTNWHIARTLLECRDAGIAVDERKYGNVDGEARNVVGLLLDRVLTSAAGEFRRAVVALKRQASNYRSD